jgi:hypothetical protein
MSNNRLGIYPEDDAREIHKRVLGHSLPLQELGQAKQHTFHNMLYYAVLTEDLASATNATTGYTSAECRVLRYVQPIDSTTLNMESATGDISLQTITNRYTTFSASIGDVLLIIRNGAEWSPVTSGGGKLQVILTTDLLAAVNTKRDPSTATARILRKKSNGDLTLSTDSITIVNRFTQISVDAGTYGKAEMIDGEWQLYAADCPGGSASSGSV